MTRAGRTVVTERTSVLENLSLFLLLAVVGLRPLISESYDLAGTDLTSALPGVADPLPILTLILDAVILSAALLWGSPAAWVRAPAYRWTGLEPVCCWSLGQ